MREKIISSDEDFELSTPDKTADLTGLQSLDEIHKLNDYWLAYSYPFMPMIGVSIAFDELSRMVKSWFLKKGTRTIDYKNNSRESI